MSRQSLTPAFGERLEAMQTLMEDVLSIQHDGEVQEDTMVRIREIVEKSGKLVEQADEAHEMVIDAQILAAGSHLVQTHVCAIDTNLTSFVPEEYTSGLLAYVEGRSLQPRYDWDILAAETCCLFKKVPPLSYMLGTFVLDPPPPPEKQKQERAKRLVDSKKNVVETIKQTEVEGETTDEIYQHILKCLVVEYGKNNKKPVSYFKFITDPNDFWRTVENVFHFSFLVRDEKVRMMLDHSGLPVVEPVFLKNANSEPGKKKKNSQFNFRFSLHEWKEVVKTYKIKKPSIKPFKHS